MGQITQHWLSALEVWMFQFKWFWNEIMTFIKCLSNNCCSQHCTECSKNRWLLNLAIKIGITDVDMRCCGERHWSGGLPNYALSANLICLFLKQSMKQCMATSGDLVTWWQTFQWLVMLFQLLSNVSFLLCYVGEKCLTCTQQLFLRTFFTALWATGVGTVLYKCHDYDYDYYTCHHPSISCEPVSKQSPASVVSHCPITSISCEPVSNQSLASAVSQCPKQSPASVVSQCPKQSPASVVSQCPINH